MSSIIQLPRIKGTPTVLRDKISNMFVPHKNPPPEPTFRITEDGKFRITDTTAAISLDFFRILEVV